MKNDEKEKQGYIKKQMPVTENIMQNIPIDQVPQNIRELLKLGEELPEEKQRQLIRLYERQKHHEAKSFIGGLFHAIKELAQDVAEINNIPTYAEGVQDEISDAHAFLVGAMVKLELAYTKELGEKGHLELE